MERAHTRDPWSEADAVFTAALERDPSDRAAFVERECGGRPELRRQVEELLEAAAAAESCFGRLPGAIGATLDECISARTGVAPDEEEAEEPAGRRIGRYRVVRRLARGGMGAVYLAERADGAFERRVALKLLRRGLDTDDILARFRSERQILADLEHPNISRLIDGGSTEDGRPYLVMEYVEGTRITDYCGDHELDVEARLRLFVEVCEAVHHAHEQGVIHRDIKPGNILVDGAGHAKLLDFGIARLLDPEARAAHTRPGLRLLTPDHASPEQVCAGEVEAPSDVYQLGLLLYELLSGVSAYRVDRRSVAELERLVCREPVAPPSSRVTEPLRGRLRGDLDAIVLRALRKDPADRYASAEALALDVRRHLEGRPVAARSGARGHRLRYFARRHRAKLALAGGAAIALVALGLLSRPGSRPAPAIVPGSVAVLPFRVSGADASLGYLRDGMVDLLSTKLTGEGGPRAIAPATVLEAWQRAGGTGTHDVAEPVALELAGRIGAERLVVGEVVGTPDRMVLSASLRDVPGGRVTARATAQGPADSLVAVVDELTARLLVLGAGESQHPLETLASASLPALRAYLEGRVEFRASNYEGAYDRFSTAVELDSTFALAAVRAHQAASWSSRLGGRPLLEVAWRGRDRLGERDRAFVTAAVGPNYPGPTSAAEFLAARRRLVAMSPDRALVRYMYADRMYHWGPVLELAEGRERAAAQFRRALELDSAFLPAYEHLAQLLYSLDRVEEATRVARALQRRAPAGRGGSFLAWRGLAARGDSAGLDSLRLTFDELADGALLRIFSIAVHDGVEVADAERAMAVLRERGLTPGVRGRVLREDFVLRLLRGRPAEAVEAAERLRETQDGDESFPRLEAANALVQSALYGDGDPTAARRAVDVLSASAFGPGDAPRSGALVPDLCTVAQWRLWHGDARGVGRAIERLRTADMQRQEGHTGPVCALLLEAIEATLRDRADAPDLVARLDSALVTSPQVKEAILEIPANLAAARLHERLGDPSSALAAVRRRMYDFVSVGFLLATSLRMEGRLAAAVGDTATAIRAYRHYLALRSDPEPPLRAQADSVRAALAELERS